MVGKAQTYNVRANLKIEVGDVRLGSTIFVIFHIDNLLGDNIKGSGVEEYFHVEAHIQEG